MQTLTVNTVISTIKAAGLTVQHQRPHCWRLHEGPTHLDSHDAAHIRTAITGIQAITAVSLQHDNS